MHTWHFIVVFVPILCFRDARLFRLDINLSRARGGGAEGEAAEGLRFVHNEEDSMRREAADLRPVLGSDGGVSLQHTPQVWPEGDPLVCWRIDCCRRGYSRSVIFRKIVGDGGGGGLLGAESSGSSDKQLQQRHQLQQQQAGLRKERTAGFVVV